MIPTTKHLKQRLIVIEELKTFKFHFHWFKKHLVSMSSVLGPISSISSAVKKWKRNFYPYGVYTLVRVHIKAKQMHIKYNGRDTYFCAIKIW